MNLTLFKADVKRNYVLLLIFLGVLGMYLSVMVGMYKPEDVASLEAMVRAIPEPMQQAFAFSDVIGDLTSYLASWLYGMLMVGFPLVYAVILGNRLVAQLVDQGSMALLLATPVSRTRIVVTQGIYALTSMFALFVAVFALGTSVCNVVHPGLLDVGAFLRLNVVTMLVNMSVLMITFCSSCVFNEARFSVGVGAAVPVGFLLMKMLGGASKEAAVLGDASLYGLYDPVEVVTGGSIVGVSALYLVIIAALFAASVIVFRRKRLPL